MSHDQQAQQPQQSHKHVPRPGAPKGVEQISSPAASAPVAAAVSLDDQQLRLENENLRLQNENLRLQLQQSEHLKAIAEAIKPRDTLEEARKKEDAIVARMERERREAREALEAGSRKFVVHLAHQLPTGASLEQPQLLVGAEHEYQARDKYKAYMNILGTVHEIAVVEVTAESGEAESAVLAAASRGYFPERLPG